jgi:hypothetical protein
MIQKLFFAPTQNTVGRGERGRRGKKREEKERGGIKGTFWAE